MSLRRRSYGVLTVYEGVTMLHLLDFVVVYDILLEYVVAVSLLPTMII